MYAVIIHRTFADEFAVAIRRSTRINQLLRFIFYASWDKLPFYCTAYTHVNCNCAQCTQHNVPEQQPAAPGVALQLHCKLHFDSLAFWP